MDVVEELVEDQLGCRLVDLAQLIEVYDDRVSCIQFKNGLFLCAIKITDILELSLGLHHLHHHSERARHVTSDNRWSVP